MRYIELFESRRQTPRVTPDMVGEHIFHGTTFFGLLNILEQNALTGFRDRTGITGVSCTTDPNWAENYSSTTRDFSKLVGEDNLFATKDRIRPIGRAYGPVMILDAQALVRDFEVLAVQWNTHGGPVEERVRGDISPLKPYLVGVTFDQPTLDVFMDVLAQKASQEKGKRLWRNRLTNMEKLIASGLLKDRAQIMREH